MCVYCEISSSHKDAFYSENPELMKSKDKGDILYLQINIVGEAGCGKTSLIDAYQADNFPSITSVSRYARYKLMRINNIPAEYLVYSEKISSQWWPEVKASQMKKPYMLVGLKKDPCSSKQDPKDKSECVTASEGEALAKSIGAASFLECSSVTNEGINKVFETAINKVYEQWRKNIKVISHAWKCLCCWNLN